MLGQIYMQDEVVWLQSNGTGNFGVPIAPTEQTIKVRLDLTTRLVRNFAGEEITASGPILMPEEPSHDDKLRINGVERPIVSAASPKAWGAPSHYEVFVA